MARFRPKSSQLPASPYITAEGYQRLQAELDARWARRREVVKALSAAAAEGDRSENAEYIYRKKELREIDRRIRYLQKRLPDLKVVNALPADLDRVYFGAWVTLEADDGSELICRIVGPDEIDAERNWISMDSPLARALLKRSIDDEVAVQAPTGERTYLIIGIRYGAA